MPGNSSSAGQDAMKKSDERVSYGSINQRQVMRRSIDSHGSLNDWRAFMQEAESETCRNSGSKGSQSAPTLCLVISEEWLTGNRLE